MLKNLNVKEFLQLYHPHVNYKIGVNYYNTRYLQLSPYKIKELEAEGIRCLNSGLNPKPLTNFNLDMKYILCFKLKI